jgi:hypothetical protein
MGNCYLCGMDKKVCIKCSEEKLISEFNKYRVYKGIRNICKSCCSLTGKIYRENNRDKINERKKIYRENNRDKINEKQKIHRENKKPDKIKEVNKNHSKLISEFIGTEIGDFVVIKYDGYYPTGNSKYPRHYFTKQCKFCDNTITQSKSKMNIHKKMGGMCMKCQGTYNINTNQKKCSSCDIWKDATTENFVRSKNRMFGLNYYCKDCHQTKSIKRRESDDVRKKEYQQKVERLKIDPLFKLSVCTRSLIKNYIKRVNVIKIKKKCKTADILGCNFFEFKEYIEKQFTDGMSWDNYGKWHLDHIVPVSLGNNEDEVIELCHHENYQPLWAYENISKGNKILLNNISESLKIRYSKYLERYPHL